jgi:hypothetical protein
VPVREKPLTGYETCTSDITVVPGPMLLSNSEGPKVG